MTTPVFVGFPKIARWSREVIVTEKIDGTNGQIFIDDEGRLWVGSRNRWVTPTDDNQGFSAWAQAHDEELRQLGPGRHFGEWWGSGIQRGYDLVKGEKRFSLFNVSRWCLHDQEPLRRPSDNPYSTKMQDILPACVGLVPVIWKGRMENIDVSGLIELLKRHGSYAADYADPEGIVIYHAAGNVAFKKTLEKDESPKSKPVDVEMPKNEP